MNSRTLCFLIRGDPPREVLLGMKKTGFGAGKVAGFGGKVESGETVEAAAVRELAEETCIEISTDDLFPLGRLTFLFPCKPEWSQVVHVFTAKAWAGNPKESDEMKPAWCLIDELPFESMWEDAVYWLPLVLKGEKIEATFVYKDDNQTVGEVNIKNWDGIEL